MAMTAAQKQDAYKFFIVSFGAITGVEYMNQINDAYNVGLTTKEIVNIYSTKPQFEAIYPRFLSNEQFADKLIENVVGASATAEAKTQAKADVVAAINAGWSKGDVVFQIFTNLSNKAADDADWGKTAAMLNNKVKVAEYYTETLLVNDLDLGALGSPLQGVTDVASTVDAAKNNGSLNNGQTFTLTANTTDVGTGNAFSAPDIFNGPSGTYLQSLNTGDKLTGTGTNPTLNATLTGTAATPTMTGVETLNLTATAATNLTLSASTGVKNINSVDSVAAPTVLGVAAALTSAGLTRTDNSLTITHANAALAGASDAITLNLNTAGSAAAQPTVTLQTATAASGYETVNIVTAGGASRLAQLTDGVSTSLATINVSGDQALRIDTALDATVKTLDASAMTEGGSVRATLQAFAAGHAVTGSLGNDRITIRDLNANDVVGLAAGTGDTLIAVDTSNTNTINGLSTNITGVETLGVVSGTGGTNTVTFDSTKVAGITGVTLTNGDAGVAVADNFVATINNEVLTSKGGNGVTLTTPSTAGNVFGTVGITVKGADTSGSDHLTINIGSDTATNTTAFNTGVITANSIETLTLNVGDGAAHTVGGVTAGALGTLNITGGTANTNFTLTGGTAVANINASAFKGDLVLTGVAAAGATATQYVEMGAGNDNFTFSLGTPGTAVAAANPINIVTGGAGADTFAFNVASNTFSTTGFTAGNVTSGSLFDRIVDLQLGGISTNASTGNDYFTVNDGGAAAVARGSSTIVNDGQVVALSTTTYTTLQAALAAVVGGTSVSKAGGGLATGVENGGANTTNVAGLFSYDGAVFLIGEIGSGAATATSYGQATNYIVAVGTVTGTLDAWDIAVL